MMPNVIFQELEIDDQLETLLGGSGRIIESQSVDSRPFSDGYFVTVSFNEMLMSPVSALARGPRTVTIAVHHAQEIDRDFFSLTAILNRIDEIILPIEDQEGTDGLRVTTIRRTGRSGNLIDDGYKTITRYATYGVLYDEFVA